jgi:alkylation response protein AidB-like acyl-CoA dehydrogenase
MNILQRLDSRIALNDEERMLLESVRRRWRASRSRRAPSTSTAPPNSPGKTSRPSTSSGLNAMFIPEAYGGAQMSYTAYLACVREISKACAATGIIWATNYHGMKPLIDWGTEEQKQRLLPRIAEGGLGALAITEPGAGSDATGMRTTFREDGDEIVVNGGKTFITNGDVADLYLLFGKWEGIAGAKEASRCWSWRRARRAVRGAAGRQDGHARFEHGDARLRQLPRAARQPARQPGRRPEDPVRLAEQVASQRGGACAGHRPRRLRGRVAYINERKQSGRRSSSSRASSSCWPTWPRNWRWSKAGCGRWRAGSTPARRTSASKPRC